jgi:hypothetical protein
MAELHQPRCAVANHVPKEMADTQGGIAKTFAHTARSYLCCTRTRAEADSASYRNQLREGYFRIGKKARTKEALGSGASPWGGVCEGLGEKRNGKE